MNLNTLCRNSIYDTVPLYRLKDGTKFKLFQFKKLKKDNVVYILAFKAGTKVHVYYFKNNKRYYVYDDYKCVIPVLE